MNLVEGAQLIAVGHVESSLVDAAAAPRQPDEGAPPATIVIAPDFVEGLTGLAAGSEIVVVTWLHQADRSTLLVHPRDDPNRGLRGVFATRSADRPNPIGLHHARVVAVSGNRVDVRQLEAIDGTPVLDIKPVLRTVDDR